MQNLALPHFPHILKIHARAFKLLTRLAGTVLDDEMLMYRLYLEYDHKRRGSLSLIEMSK